MARAASPYQAPGFYDRALARGRHRQITGGWWEETGRLQLAALRAEGMGPGDLLLDIGCGALRLGCKAVPFLAPGNYWGTDPSAALMAVGRARELPDPARLPPGNLIADADFAYPGVPGDIAYAICFAVLPHLPPGALDRALAGLGRFAGLRAFLFTVFLPPGGAAEPGRPVTHPDRAPWHRDPAAVREACAAQGFSCARREGRLPRGQVLFVARPGAGAASAP